MSKNWLQDYQAWKDSDDPGMLLSDVASMGSLASAMGCRACLSMSVQMCIHVFTYCCTYDLCVCVYLYTHMHRAGCRGLRGDGIRVDR